MPISVEWANAEKTLIFRRIWDYWDHNDVHRMTDETRAMLSQVSHVVDVIVDCSAPSNADPTHLISAIRRSEKMMPENLGVIILVKANTFVQTLLNINRLNAPRLTSRARLVDSMSEAYALLEKLKPQDSPVYPPLRKGRPRRVSSGKS